jgi:hypothetical protein
MLLNNCLGIQPSVPSMPAAETGMSVKFSEVRIFNRSFSGPFRHLEASHPGSKPPSSGPRTGRQPHPRPANNPRGQAAKCVCVHPDRRIFVTFHLRAADQKQTLPLYRRPRGTPQTSSPLETGSFFLLHALITKTHQHAQGPPCPESAPLPRQPNRKPARRQETR